MNCFRYLGCLVTDNVHYNVKRFGVENISRQRNRLPEKLNLKQIIDFIFNLVSSSPYSTNADNDRADGQRL